MHTTTLVTNLKGPTRAYGLAEKTLIIGDNEAGKSAITQSLQLCLRGSATGLLFRDEVKLTGALNLMCGDTNGLDIQATQDDGTVFTFKAPIGKKAQHSGPKEAMNLDSSAVREAFKGSVDKLVTFLAQNMVGTNLTVRWAQQGVKIAAMRDESKAISTAISEAENALNACGSPDAASESDVSKLVDRMGFARTIRSLSETAKASGNDELRAALRAVATFYGRQHFDPSVVYDTQDVIKLVSNHLKWKDIGEKRTTRDATEVELAALKTKIKQEERELDKISHDLLDEFEKRVVPYLYPGETIHIDRDTGYTNLVRGRGQHAALSGSTEARVLAAIAAALSIPGLPGVLILDDRMWSADNLIATMEALKDAPCQVIITSTIDVTCAGWENLYV